MARDQSDNILPASWGAAVAQLAEHWSAYHGALTDTDYLVLASAPSPLAAVLADDWKRLHEPTLP